MPPRVYQEVMYQFIVVSTLSIGTAVSAQNSSNAVHNLPHSRCRFFDSASYKQTGRQTLIKYLGYVHLSLVETISQRIATLPKFCARFLKMLNLFPSVPPSTDEYTLRTQRISTRLFILSLSLSLTILLIYTAAVNIQKTVIVPNPSLEKYQQLYERYSSTLACPCTHISVKYGSFMRINYTLHQVCNSVYVTKEWFSFIALTVNKWHLVFDFRTTGLYTFQALSSLCASIGIYIDVNIFQFDSSASLSASVLPELYLKAQSDLQIDQFISSTTASFLSSLNIIGHITESSTFLSALRTYFDLEHEGNYTTGYPTWRNFGYGCDCSTGYECSLQSAIHQNDSLNSSWPVPGFYTACFVLESLRISSLTCFYSQSCLTELQVRMESTRNMSLVTVELSNTSRFSPNTTIGAILDLLMVEHWNWSVTYEDYYAACQPSECRYTLTTKNDALYIVTTLIGLIGGLVTVLKWIVPRLVVFVDKHVRHRKVSTILSLHAGESKIFHTAANMRIEDY